MKWRSWRPLAALALLMLFAVPVKSGNRNVKQFVMFNGTQGDTTEAASIWIPIRGASRVYLRTWSNGAAADTNFCDSISTWKTLLSDSVSFIGRDSLGTLVTSRTSPRYDPTVYGRTWPVCADSVVVTGQIADSLKFVAVVGPAITRPLKASATGSGRYTIILPTAVGGAIPASGASSAVAAANDVFMVGYLRIRVTPTTRLTTAGFSSTQGIRTAGIRTLRMEAYVVYDNQ